MFSHPVSIVGYVLIFIGFILGLMSDGRDFQTGFTLLAGGAAFQQLGAFLILLGVIAQGFLMLDARLAGQAGPKAVAQAKRGSKPASAEAEASEAVEVDEAELLRRRMMEMGVRT